MSQSNPIGALLTGGALHRVLRTGVGRIPLGGVRVLPFRAALGLLLSSIRPPAVQKGSRKEVERTYEPRRRRAAVRRDRNGLSGRGGHSHG